MQRRLALALSLAFTTIVTFSVMTVGAQAGLFSQHSTAKASQVAADVPAADPAAVDPTAAPAEQDPLIVTDYVYVDEAAAPASVRITSAPSPRPATAVPLAQPKVSAAANTNPTAVQPSPVTEPTRPADPTRAPDPTQAAVPTRATAPTQAAQPTAPPSQPRQSTSPVGAAPREGDSEHERDD